MDQNYMNRYSIGHKRRIGIGSQTESQKARKILRSANIFTSVIKIENRMKDGGCLYGLECDFERIGDVIRILRENGIFASIVG